MAAERLLVPLSESVTVRQTVAHAVRSGFGDGGDGDGECELHLVVAMPDESAVPGGEESVDRAEDLLDRAAAWAAEDAADRPISIETAVLGTDEYLFGPRDYAREFADYAEANEIDLVVLDPEYQPGGSSPVLLSLERELERHGVAYEEASVERSARHERVVGRASFDRYFALFWVSYGFYLVLGDPTYWFDLLTGAAVAAIVSYTLAHVTFAGVLDRVQSPVRTLRFGLFVPYLVFEIVRANLAISVVILRPSMPIDPRVTRVRAWVPGGLPLLALANSITLTPGTLTVRANDQRLVVHTLIPTAREDLFDGGLERAVRFVFFGRDGARIPSPRERGDTEIVGGDEV